MLQEFKEFALKGNVIDMAVGIIIGAAFSTVVKTLVDEIIMPPLGMITGKVDFSDKYLLLQDGPKQAAPYASLPEAKQAGAVVIAYGQLLNAIISFVMVALALFFLVRWMNRLRRSGPPPAPNTKNCPYCKSAIDIEASRCAHCTSELEQPAAT